MIVRSPVIGALACLLAAGVAHGASVEIRRTNNRSPVYHVSASDVGFYMNYTGYRHSDKATGAGERFFNGSIGPKVLDMIGKAQRVIILSVFLFDSFVSHTETPKDVVGRLTAALVDQKRKHPGMIVAVILDPSHKAYAQRVSPAERRLRANGVDVFYSDLLSGLKRASFLGVRETMGHVGRGLDVLTFNRWGDAWSKVLDRAPLPGDIDGEQATAEMAFNAALLKANHRKLLVTDKHGGDLEVMVSSANPHNASAYHVNTSLTVSGPLASYVYMVLREDIRHCVRRGRRFAHWHDDARRAYRKSYLKKALPVIAVDPGGAELTATIQAVFVSESEIPDAILRALDAVKTDDQVRIQMFYLSYQPVLDAILRASRVVRSPIRLLLDANKDSFNREKDGTPNRQVARYLLREAGKGRIAIRWYATHGEQNHAKVMSISSDDGSRSYLTTGSCNWTGRNMAGVNMESNVEFRDAHAVTTAFEALFDRFWSNAAGAEYSLDYETFSDQIASDLKWKLGEKPYYYSTF